MENMETKESSNSDNGMEEDAIQEEHANQEQPEDNDDRPTVYLPGQPLKEGEELVHDPSAYKMLHQAQTGAPCLSFDIILDHLGDKREDFPHSCYLVAGTQAARTHANNIIVMKLSNLHKTIEKDSEDEDEASDDEDGAKKPVMTNVMIKHLGCINRIRSTVCGGANLAATWSELGRVNIWDLTAHVQMVDNPLEATAYSKNNSNSEITPLFTFSGHQQEGFALDWCKTSPGVLATGDCKQDIHIWKPAEGGQWTVDQRPLVGHTQSVEDLQWSPNEQNVLASCSVDRSIRIWDIRASPKKACMLACENAHEKDINVISWNRNEPFIISGGDDGFLHVWDLRQFVNKTPVATFKHHTAPVTTVEWLPSEHSIFASGGEDNQVALWDLSVERDSEDTSDEIQDLPPQLLFIHQGQTDIKEVHWHPQIPGVLLSTAHSGFNIFRTISV